MKGGGSIQIARIPEAVRIRSPQDIGITRGVRIRTIYAYRLTGDAQDPSLPVFFHPKV